MSQVVPSSSPSRLTGAEIHAQLQILRESDPQLRARDLSRRLGVSEAELVASRCGLEGEEGALRLQPRWQDLVQALPRLGRVMCLTRNDHCVHEKHGRFDKVSVFRNQGLVLDPEIDLRIFFARWKSGFAVREQVRSGLRESIQIFDRHGTAVHKIYLTEETDADAWRSLIEEFRDSDQTRDLAVVPISEEPVEEPPEAFDPQELRTRWDALQDSHEFFPLLQRFKLGRIAAFRVAGPDYARPLNVVSFRKALEGAAWENIPIMVFTGSPGVIQIHSGPVENLRETGPWFNVLDKGFNLHLHQPGIASAWLVRKPSRDGIVTSLEIFDAQERQIAWMFGARKPGTPELQEWRQLAERLESEEALLS
jgi:putative hemin transport protein